MDTKMMRAARVELADVVRRRYSSAASKDKRRILEELIAATGYHEKSAIRVLNSQPAPKHCQTRRRPPLYDDAARAALIVLWEASDRVCGKRLKALLPILLPALERNGHLNLDESLRPKILSMSAATIDRLLRTPRNATRARKPRRAEPEPRRRTRMRTFADWNEPHPGSMEMDLVAHCGAVNRGSYVHSLVMTDVASGWTEAAPLVVRDGGMVVETLERIRVGLPFALRALDVDNGSEFVNDKLIEYCLRHGIELTRSRPYRKNDQAWVEQKNGAIVRKLLGYRRARVSKRYHPPQTPCERLLQADSVPTAAQDLLRKISAAFVASLSSAWRAGEIRPTFSVEAKPRYLRGLRNVSAQACRPAFSREPKSLSPTTARVEAPAKTPERPPVIYAESGSAKIQALRMVWPIACRRLEDLPNISATQLFEELCIQFPGRFTQRQYRTLLRRVNRWREDARARGVVVGPKTYRRLSDKPRGRRPDIFKEHWRHGELSGRAPGPDSARAAGRVPATLRQRENSARMRSRRSQNA